MCACVWSIRDSLIACLNVRVYGHRNYHVAYKEVVVSEQRQKIKKTEKQRAKNERQRQKAANNNSNATDGEKPTPRYARVRMSPTLPLKKQRHYKTVSSHTTCARAHKRTRTPSNADAHTQVPQKECHPRCFHHQVKYYGKQNCKSR